MAKRKYTGWDRNASGRRAGTERLIKLIIEWSDGAFFNNGSWLVRSKRGKSAAPRVMQSGQSTMVRLRSGQHTPVRFPPRLAPGWNVGHAAVCLCA